MNNPEIIASQVTSLLNSYGDKDAKTFLDYIQRSHRTLQQSFTKLCLKWILRVASDEYRFDGRNEASHYTCKAIVDTMKEKDSIPLDALPII